MAFALASDGTSLYVGGAFTNAGGVLVTNIARFDGTNWHALGVGVGYYIGGLTPAVNVLGLRNGLFYAGGSFANAGGVPAANIAVWNGSGWAALGAGAANGVNGEVSALAFLGNDLYVGGNFSTAGGVSAFGVARWNGVAWSPLGEGCKGTVSCIRVLGSDIYVGGSFTNVGGVSARAFAKWNGSTWTTWPIHDWVFQYPLNGTLNCMVVKGDSLYIVGNLDQAGGIIANRVVRYDGTRFYLLGQRPANGFSAPHINVGCIGQADDGIYVGGLFNAAEKAPANRIPFWDGTNWHALGSGFSAESAVVRGTGLAIRGNDVFAVSTFTGAGLTESSGIAR